MQFALMEDVTGFNQKNQSHDGESMIHEALRILRQRYSEHIVEIIRLMLKFDESQRPSFTELSKLVLTSTENTIESPKGPAGAKVERNVQPMSGQRERVDSKRSLDQRGKQIGKVQSMRELKKEDRELESERQPSSKLKYNLESDCSIQPSLNKFEDS